MSHAFFSPSKSGMWIPCPGSMAFPENQVDGGSSPYADDGTASHHWAAAQLQGAQELLGSTLELNGKTYTLDDERQDFIDIYVDDVTRRSIGGDLYVEYHVDLSHILGAKQGGTADAGIYVPRDKHLIVEDLKYGTGEKVYASYILQPAQGDVPEVREINPQLGLYLLGLYFDMRLLGYKVEKVTGVICQPRLGHIDEYTITMKELMTFAAKATVAVELAGNAMTVAPNSLTMAGYLNPSTRTCRWCQAKTKCPALARFVLDETRADFDEPSVAPVPIDTVALGKAYAALPLIAEWCRAVESSVKSTVAGGLIEVIGADGKPLKFVEGKEGSRKWSDEKLAEGLLVGVLGQKAYTTPKVITAPQAAKLLDKKATKATWTDVFEPLIVRPRGQPILALGSDPRPPFTGTASADDFAEDLGE